MPAVLRTALGCVPRRTLTSVLARLRSISFCRFLTLGQSCSCVCADVQRDDGGVVGGDDAGVGEGPAGGFRRGLGMRAGGLVVSLPWPRGGLGGRGVTRQLPPRLRRDLHGAASRGS